MSIDTGDQVRGIIITINGKGTEYDFISRYFAPWVGIPEDPVTGSAHTVLTPYWSSELGKYSNSLIEFTDMKNYISTLFPNRRKD